ncbi:MAG: PAS domain-containing sensor histidine kinase [Myxococcales bacterium]|nr:PAS domain-containing sensor histidine kinase [Myxococcales bacterium]
MRTKLFLVFAGMILISGAVANRFLDKTIRATAEANVERALRLSVRAVALLAADTPTSAWSELTWQKPLAGVKGEVALTLFGPAGRRLAGVELQPPEDDRHHSAEVDRALAGEESFARVRVVPGQEAYVVATTPVLRSGQVVGAVRAAIDNAPAERALTEARRSLGIAIVILLGVAGVGAWAGPRIFADGVSGLLNTAARMAKGDLRVRSPMNIGEPLLPLAQALDLLAGNLSSSLDDLKAERDLVGRILERMEEGVLVLDTERRVTLINPALRDVLMPRPGLATADSHTSALDVRGRTVLEVFRHAELSALLDRSSEGERVRGEIEVQGLRPRRLMVTATRFTEGGYLAVFVDVTEIRRLESLRRDFVANVSHELRTPVAAIRSAAETLPMTIEAQDSHAGLRFVDIIERNADRLQSLVEDLLDLSRIESREYRLQIEPLSVTRIVNQIFGLFRDRAERRKITLVSDIPANLPPLHTDRRALETVLSNLIDNAVKYCPDGSRVAVRAALEADRLRLEVEDSGQGIEAQHLPRIFERFYRIDPGRSRSKGGTGLGLSIVKHLTEAMGGTTTVASVVGKGTTFTLRLPRARTDAMPSPTNPEDSLG